MKISIYLLYAIIGTLGAWWMGDSASAAIQNLFHIHTPGYIYPIGILVATMDYKRRHDNDERD